MENFDRQAHWENIYNTKALKDVSWFQPSPETSLNFLKQLNISKTASIIDIGGGDSLLVDHLLELGYQDISVLDISGTAIARAKQRLGAKADQVKWMISDITAFVPPMPYDFWHDRAAFHFLTNEQDVANYVEVAQKSIKPQGILVVGTFSLQGPTKCSGIEIKQYSEDTLTERFNLHFDKIQCATLDHITPSGSIQNFVFCSFRKRKTN